METWFCIKTFTCWSRKPLWNWRITSPVHRTGGRSLWWSSACTAGPLWAPCVEWSAWCGNSAGPAPASAPPAPEGRPLNGASRISANKEGFFSPVDKLLFPLSISNLTYLDVKGDLRGEVSEGAGNDHPGTLRNTAASRSSLRRRTESTPPEEGWLQTSMQQPAQRSHRGSQQLLGPTVSSVMCLQDWFLSLTIVIESRVKRQKKAHKTKDKITAWHEMHKTTNMIEAPLLTNVIWMWLKLRSHSQPDTTSSGLISHGFISINVRLKWGLVQLPGWWSSEATTNPLIWHVCCSPREQAETCTCVWFQMWSPLVRQRGQL